MPARNYSNRPDTKKGQADNADLVPLLGHVLTRLQETLRAKLADPEAHLS
ncbi:hypothetical protein [Holophaga foetida]|nr:hypothetical protein [Holophaga foetida]